MRTMFANLNSLRDSARSGLPDDERQLLFGDGTPACVSDEACALAEATEKPLP